MPEAAWAGPQPGRQVVELDELENHPLGHQALAQAQRPQGRRSGIVTARRRGNHGAAIGALGPSCGWGCDA